MRADQLVDVRLAWRPPGWIRALVWFGRRLRWIARTAWLWRFELACMVAFLLIRDAASSVVGTGPAALLMVDLIGGLAAWPASRRIVVSRAWCSVSRRRLVACLRKTKTRGRIGDIPIVVRSRRTAVGERITLWCRLGQSAEEIGSRVDALRAAFWCSEVRVARHPRQAQLVDVEVVRRDTLTAAIDALPVPDVPDVSAVCIGRREDGSRWILRLLGNHVLAAGVTGAGKGSVIWSLIRGVAPAIRSGLVEVWAVDPKGGMELGLGTPLFTRFACADYAEVVDLLEDAVTVMKDRAARLAGHVRQLVPTPDEPLVVVLVDEIANLTAYLPDRDLRRRADAALALLLTQGRAVGVSVVAALQDPRKEILNYRNLFPTKIALRLDEAEQVDMVLGKGARERGALADTISETAPGVAYVREDGTTGVVRARAAYVDDQHIVEMASTYAAGSGRPSAVDEVAA
jgi:S-DNA-T family DNA segregation ATPase FtsK/SpoIIIE